MKIEICVIVESSLEKVWSAWTEPKKNVKWNYATDEWCCPNAEVDLTVGGKFKYRMDAKDGSMGFDFEGKFVSIEQNSRIEFSLDDDRKVLVEFKELESGIQLKETFDAEDDLSGEQQREGWQSILNNFKQYVESAT